MRAYLPEVNQEKLDIIFRVKEQFNQNKITLEEGKKILKEQVGSLEPFEIALVEQELQELRDDECRKEDIQKMLLLFEDVLQKTDMNLDEGHPIQCYLSENKKMKDLLKQVEELLQYPIIKNQWTELLNQLNTYRIHLSRKQNQLYSILEQKGFDRPTTTMWTLDDYIRDEISELRNKLQAITSNEQEDQFVESAKTMVADVLDLMQKEETILYPTSLKMISESEFEQMKSGDREIGYCFISPVQTTSKKHDETMDSSSSFEEELLALCKKYQPSLSQEKVDVAMGKLTLEQINLIYRHLPIDISFVDENDLVCFYSDTPHRIFPRSKNVIGRNVQNCHPRHSVHIVNEIIEKFRSGEQDHAEFWIEQEGAFIYILYTAVRDKDGNFKGVLEMMQDCYHIRSLQGSNTLLNWENTASKEETKQEETKQEEMKDSTQANESITKDTRLMDLLKQYPTLKEKLVSINPAFAMLNTPLGKAILPKVTIEIMSERSGMDLSVLIQKLKDAIK